jgi:hypothetical protein
MRHASRDGAGRQERTTDNVKSIGWNVYLGGKLIDTVWFDEDMSAEDVRRSLINHDGYDPAITVRR